MDAPGAILIVRGKDIDGVASHSKRPAEKIALRALVLQRNEVGEQLTLADLATLLEGEGHGRICFHRSNTVDAGHRRDDNDVVTLEQGARCRMAHAIDLLVDR